MRDAQRNSWPEGMHRQPLLRNLRRSLHIPHSAKMIGTSVQYKRTVAAVVCLTLGGCNSQTLMTVALPPPGTKVTGVPYYLPVGNVPISITGAPVTKKESEAAPPQPYKIDVTVSPTTYAADRNAPVFLQYDHSSFAADQFNLAVDANGLLQSSSSTATDESGAVVLKVAELVGQLVALTGGVPTTNLGILGLRVGPTTPPRAPCRLPPFVREKNLNPDQSPKIDPVTEPKGQRIDFSISPVQETFKLAPGVPAPLAALREPPEPIGVLFRRPAVRRYSISIKPNEAASSACGLADYTSDRYASVPDTTSAGLYWQDTGRAPLVKKTVKLAVSNGMLIGVDVDNPSEVLAFASLPIDIIKALLSAPASILTLKVQQMNAQQGIANAQLKAIQSQIDLLQKTAALQQARAAAAKPGTAGTE